MTGLSLTSAIPAIKAALVDGLDALAVFAQTPVTWGIPAGESALEWLRWDDAVGDQTTATLNPNRRPRDENSDLTGVVTVRRSGGGQRLATERAFEIAGEVEKFLRADPTLGGVAMWALITRVELNESAAGDTRQAEVTLIVSARARVQGP